jgi:hypothetical protein
MYYRHSLRLASDAVNSSVRMTLALKDWHFVFLNGNDVRFDIAGRFEHSHQLMWGISGDSSS